MAQAVLEIRPDAKLGFGPPVENGFYYDFDFGENPIGDSEFKNLEKRMMKMNLPFISFRKFFIAINNE